LIRDAMKKKSTNVTTAKDYKGPNKLAAYLGQFKVYPGLTQKLDQSPGPISQENINEIVLWKVGRYVDVPTATLAALNKLKDLKPGEHEKGAEVLNTLLALDGVRLPMASTFLRFANPRVFQIYDRHMWRSLYGELHKVNLKKPETAVPLYWQFLNELHTQCRELKINFGNADRILFEFDKAENPPLSDSED
jgi:thermostable 8-oxoguanine DNA glycosylase